jgi:SAM-dependent methyltransferase
MSLQQHYSDWLKHINSLIIVQHRELLTGLVADFGCGDRRYSYVLVNELASNVLAIDKELKIFSMDILHPFVEFLQGDLHDLPLETGSLDNAVSFHTLEHLPDPGKAVREMARVLKCRGNLVVSVPYLDAYFVEDHKHFFDVDTLQALFENNGFETQIIARDRRTDGHQNTHNAITGVFRKGG